MFLMTLVKEHFELVTQKQCARSKTKYIYIIIIIILLSIVRKCDFRTVYEPKEIP